MKRSIFPIFLALSILIGGCAKAPAPEAQKYSVVFFDYFDTVITLTGYARDRATFDAVAARAETMFARLHQVYDRYEAHDGIAGVWAINHAGGQPVKVEEELYDLLVFAQEYYEPLERRTNIMMGSVLKLWHDYRTAAQALPSQAELADANAHSDFGNLVLDTAQKTAQILDPEASMDLGAIAKGYAVELVGRAIEKDMPSYLIDGGGNIKAGAAPQDGRDAWTVGVTDPGKALSGERDLSMKIKLTGRSAVTSGGYQRYYIVDGKRYHHLIDPDTLMPANYVLQVTVLSQDSGLADMLSTAAFLLPQAESRGMIESLPGVDAIWMLSDGTIQMTNGVMQ